VPAASVSRPVRVECNRFRLVRGHGKGRRARPSGRIKRKIILHRALKRHQKISLADICIWRDVPKSPAAYRVPLVMMPSVEDPTVVVGLPKLV
jgi:hypothetical protein